ncbi:MAG: hypothetical protein M0Q95_05310 [Porticoccaceae bacterium]|nr:hypothetical protein [Porticoccaceae bacterium]
MPKYTQPRKTWQYTTDFKIKVVKLSQQDGLHAKQVAEEPEVWVVRMRNAMFWINWLMGLIQRAAGLLMQPHSFE